ncbi:hypothetical protein [Chthoniobacter flavus]|uniref:hypothetical protein n=1 Tax=Chthoniobacter flavus TaxID=191863 RepID=UPI0010482CFA|nr:hypothetical protein [Chthoniobacter flavus]
MSVQRELLQRFRQIAEMPDRYADYTERDAIGRDVNVHIIGKFAVKYWDDFADRQVKILDLHAADRRGPL